MKKLTFMPNQKSKEAKRAAKFAADEELARVARKALLEEERTQFRAEADENTRAGKPSSGRKQRIFQCNVFYYITLRRSSC